MIQTELDLKAVVQIDRVEIGNAAFAKTSSLITRHFDLAVCRDLHGIVQHIAVADNVVMQTPVFRSGNCCLDRRPIVIEGLHGKRHFGIARVIGNQLGISLRIGFENALRRGAVFQIVHLSDVVSRIDLVAGIHTVVTDSAVGTLVEYNVPAGFVRSHDKFNADILVVATVEADLAVGTTANADIRIVGHRPVAGVVDTHVVVVQLQNAVPFRTHHQEKSATLRRVIGAGIVPVAVYRRCVRCVGNSRLVRQE